MSDVSPLDPLKAAIRSLVGWLRSQNVKGLVIGGVAASLLGRPRTTRDVDAVVWLSDADLEGFFRAANDHGLVPRMKDSLEFARQARVLLMNHPGSGIDIDVSLGALPFERNAIDRVKTVALGDVSVPLPTVEDLIVMKAVAHRPRDAGDIEGLLDAHRAIDRQYIRRVVGEFADALETPEILSDLETLFSRIPGDDYGNG